jgi:5-methylcytosine-specific restriction endonuclease McrA
MSRTLVLDLTYQPLAVVALRRAVVLVLADKADVVEADGEWHSVSTAVPTPTVIRLRRYVRVPYRRTVALSRRNVLTRDAHRCAYCRRPASTVDHVIPRSRQGRHRWDNVVASCGTCNHTKADRLLHEIGWTLPFTPAEPSSWSLMILSVTEAEPAWEPYLPASLAAPTG